MDKQINASLNVFQHDLRSFVLRRVKDKSLADDIVQDVFLKVHSKIGQLKDSEKLLGWIYQITRNAITDHFRASQKTIDPSEIEWDAAGEGNKLNECVANCLQQLTQTLPEKYREALQLAELENISQLQLAERLGISYSGAKSRVQRARQILKKKMEDILIIKTDPYGNIIVCEDRNPCDGCSPC